PNADSERDRAGHSVEESGIRGMLPPLRLCVRAPRGWRPCRKEGREGARRDHARDPASGFPDRARRASSKRPHRRLFESTAWTWETGPAGSATKEEKKAAPPKSRGAWQTS